MHVIILVHGMHPTGMSHPNRRHVNKKATSTKHAKLGSKAVMRHDENSRAGARRTRQPLKIKNLFIKLFKSLAPGRAAGGSFSPY